MITALIIMAAVAYSGALIALARGPLFVDSHLVGAIVNIIGAFVPLLLFTLAGTNIHNSGSAPAKGLIWAVVGGVMIGVFTLALTRLFKMKVEVDYVVPLVYGGAIVITTLCSRFVFKESLTWMEAVGIGVVTLGIGLVVIAKYQGGVQEA